MKDDFKPQIVQALDDVYLSARQRLDWVNLSRSATIHRVRIAFKSFRYMVEIIHPLLDDYPVETLKRMNDYQALLGEIQDTEVFAQTLAAYSEAINLFHTFWHSKPEEPFPWEKTK
jgi:CHAD domain-containing protein